MKYFLLFALTLPLNAFAQDWSLSTEARDSIPTPRSRSIELYPPLEITHDGFTIVSIKRNVFADFVFKLLSGKANAQLFRTAFNSPNMADNVILPNTNASGNIF
jgi:hypothetical protein